MTRITFVDKTTKVNIDKTTKVKEFCKLHLKKMRILATDLTSQKNSCFTFKWIKEDENHREQSEKTIKTKKMTKIKKKKRLCHDFSDSNRFFVNMSTS